MNFFSISGVVSLNFFTENYEYSNAITKILQKLGKFI